MHSIYLFIYLFISRELIGSLRSLVLRHDSLKKSLKKDAAKFNISWLFLIIQLLQWAWHEKRWNLKVLVLSRRYAENTKRKLIKKNFGVDFALW